MVELGQEIAKIQDSFARLLFGRTLTDAHAQGICVKCGEKVGELTISITEWREYQKSGLCAKCWKSIG